MLILPNHPASTSLTMLSYDREAGLVRVKTTHPTDIDPVESSVPLAQFLRDIGIPFRAARDIARAERGLWNPEPTEPAVA